MVPLVRLLVLHEVILFAIGLWTKGTFEWFSRVQASMETQSFPTLEYLAAKVAGKDLGAMSLSMGSKDTHLLEAFATNVALVWS
jgi:hypothetical protein